MTELQQEASEKLVDYKKRLAVGDDVFLGTAVVVSTLFPPVAPVFVMLGELRKISSGEKYAIELEKVVCGQRLNMPTEPEFDASYCVS